MNHPNPTQDPFKHGDPSTFTATDHRGNRFEFTGRVIGAGSTQRDDHSHAISRDRPYAAQRQSCSACRWFEAYIYIVTRPPERYPESGRYLVVTVGGTVVPGEVDFHRANFTDSGFEVVELLTIRKSGSEPYLATSAARALAQAAAVDDDVREAFINRATV